MSTTAQDHNAKVQAFLNEPPEGDLVTLSCLDGANLIKFVSMLPPQVTVAIRASGHPLSDTLVKIAEAVGKRVGGLDEVRLEMEKRVEELKEFSGSLREDATVEEIEAHIARVEQKARELFSSTFGEEVVNETINAVRANHGIAPVDSGAPDHVEMTANEIRAKAEAAAEATGHRVVHMSIMVDEDADAEAIVQAAAEAATEEAERQSAARPPRVLN